MNGADMDLRTLTDDELDDLRRDILTEQERRAKVEQLPDQLAAMTRDAVAAGCDPDVIRGRVDDALAPEEQATLAAVPTEPEPGSSEVYGHLS